jgi:hypothetical protein
MGKVLILLLLALLAIGSLSGYLFLTHKITAGSLQIAAGQQQLAQGEQMLANGKDRLARGQQQLSQAQNTYKKVKAAPLWAAAVSPITGVLMEAGKKVASSKIAAGQQQVARGQEKIKNGEEQLAAGKLELAHGMEQLKLANTIRVVCAAGTIFFILLLSTLGCYWRRSLIKLVKHSS